MGFRFGKIRNILDRIRRPGESDRSGRVRFGAARWCEERCMRNDVETVARSRPRWMPCGICTPPRNTCGGSGRKCRQGSQISTVRENEGSLQDVLGPVEVDAFVRTLYDDLAGPLFSFVMRLTR